MDVFTQPFRDEQDVNQSQVLSGTQLVSIQSFFSPKLVALPKLKNQFCLTIYS